MFYHVAKVSRLVSRKFRLVLVEGWDEAKQIVQTSDYLSVKEGDVVILGYTPIPQSPNAEVRVIEKLEGKEGEAAWDEMRAYRRRKLEGSGNAHHVPGSYR
jgi:hypothetical protein